MPGLPDEKKIPNTDPARLTGLLYGLPKIGKTSWFATFPDTLFLTTEPGTKGQEIFEYNSDDGGCKNWDLVRAAVDLLEKTDRFSTVVMDTGDEGYTICFDWTCKREGISHPSDADYGKGWGAIATEFRDIVNRIVRTGRGVWFTSHVKETEHKPRGGTPFTKITPTLGTQAWKVIVPLCDLVIYCEYMTVPATRQTQRVMITTGDEMVLAGGRRLCRGTEKIVLPRFLPLQDEGGYDTFLAACHGEDVGLDPETLVAPRTASEDLKGFLKSVIKKGQREAQQREAKKKKKKKRRRTA